MTWYPSLQIDLESIIPVINFFYRSPGNMEELIAFSDESPNFKIRVLPFVKNDGKALLLIYILPSSVLAFLFATQAIEALPKGLQKIIVSNGNSLRRNYRARQAV